MALIPPFMLDCVVAIGFHDPDGKVAYAGTGFLYGRYLSIDSATNQRQYRVYLVTNRHVLDGETTAYLRFNPEAGTPAQVFDASLLDQDGKPIWFSHADPEIDIAVLQINTHLLQQSKIQFSFFQSDQHILSHKDAAAAGLSEGDGVFVLGFPMGNVGVERNYVVVRQGVIARIRDSILGAAKEFLIAQLCFPEIAADL
jgi:hypothetical protein